MKMFAMAALAAVCVTTWAQAVNAPSGGGAIPQGDYYDAYSVRNQISIVGRVTGTSKGESRQYPVETESILLKSDDGKVHQVDLGPTWFVSRQAAKVKVGDRLKVVGSPVVIR